MLKSNLSVKPAEPLPGSEPIPVLPSSVVPNDIISSPRSAPVTHGENTVEEQMPSIHDLPFVAPYNTEEIHNNSAYSMSS